MTTLELATTDDLTPRLGALRPIGLEELTARAALQTRTDRKYLLPLPLVADLVEELSDRVLVLQIGAGRTFGYESVYFDTSALTSFRLAAHRRPARFKVRSRTYLDSTECWLEVKTRDRRGRTVKHRQAHDAAVPAALGEEGARFVDDVLGAAGLAGATPSAATLHPTLVTRYRRSTLYLPADDSRLTIDTQLTCLLDEEHHVHLPSRAVVESKTALHASAVDRLLWSRGHRPVRLSKYATGLAALHPDLPATPWRPVLRRHPFVTAAPDTRSQPAHRVGEAAPQHRTPQSP